MTDSWWSRWSSYFTVSNTTASVTAIATYLWFMRDSYKSRWEPFTLPPLSVSQQMTRFTSASAFSIFAAIVFAVAGKMFTMPIDELVEFIRVVWFGDDQQAKREYYARKTAEAVNYVDRNKNWWLIEHRYYKSMYPNAKYPCLGR